MEALLIDYVSAGLDAGAFWGLTYRLYDLHMRGAAKRIEREIELSNRQAYNTAALTGGAFAGNLPAYDKVFRKRISAGVRQSAEVLEANLRALARVWGAR